MRHVLIRAALLVSLGLAACADHSRSLPAADADEQAPIPSPDETASHPALPTGSSGTTSPWDSASDFDGGGPPRDVGGPVPEPSTMLLVGAGLVGAAVMRRRKQRAAARAADE